jgi:hypothetical protein
MAKKVSGIRATSKTVKVDAVRHKDKRKNIPTEVTCHHKWYQS